MSAHRGIILKQAMEKVLVTVLEDLLSVWLMRLSGSKRVSIKDASDFFSWTQQHQSASSVSFTFVSKEACQTAKS